MIIANTEGDEEEVEKEEAEHHTCHPANLNFNGITDRSISSIFLVGRILGKNMQFLVDTGATHNFVDLVTAQCLCL